MAELRIREAVRAILLTPDLRVLLVRFEFPVLASSETRTRWALPGGGIDPGETAQDALRRELSEELGHDVGTIGPHVWNRLHVIPFPNGLWDGQREQVHLVPVPEAFEPQPVFTWDQLHAEHVFEMRWWSLPEIAAAIDVHFVPQDLAVQLAQLVEHGPPKVPIDVAI